ncbi:MAG: lysylphosphatidylglycerol synthase domain-containing protein, partial [Planctomycetota bacterium]
MTSDFRVLSLLDKFSVSLFIVAVLLAFLPWLTYVLRLAIWLRFLGIRYELRTLFRINLAHEMGIAIAPALIGGTPVKAGMLMQMGVSTGHSLSLTILGSLEEWTFLLIGFPVLFSLFGAWDLPIFARIAGFLSDPYVLITLGSIVVLVLIVFVANRKGRKILQKSSVYRFLSAKLS